MSSTHHPPAWQVHDLTFLELELRHPTDSQMRIEFTCGTRLVITERNQIDLAAELIATLRSAANPKGAQS